MLALAAVVAVGGVVFTLTGGNDGPLGRIIPGTGDPSLTTPPFEFHVAKVVGIPTNAAQTAKKLKGAAQQAAKQTTAVLDTFYTESFLDPENWTNGSYDSAFAVFDRSASEQAQVSAAALTAGAEAGDTYDQIQPGRGVIQTRILMDLKGQPYSAVAKVRFTAQGANQDGSTTLFVSEGQFFLQKVDGDWKVIAFDVQRSDKVKQPTPSPSSASGSPSGSPS